VRPIHPGPVQLGLPRVQISATKTVQGWPKLWANFKALVGVFSQSVGPSLAVWANSVQLSVYDSDWPQPIPERIDAIRGCGGAGVRGSHRPLRKAKQGQGGVVVFELDIQRARDANCDGGISRDNVLVYSSAHRPLREAEQGPCDPR
jgi:hypothetical protein